MNKAIAFFTCWSSLTLSIVKDTHFIDSLELDANDSPKIAIVQALNNPINILLINQNIILYRVFP